MSLDKYKNDPTAFIRDFKPVTDKPAKHHRRIMKLILSGKRLYIKLQR